MTEAKTFSVFCCVNSCSLRLKFLAFLTTIFSLAHATHYRAGEITYRIIGINKIEATVWTYTKISGQSLLADRPMVGISWGDGTGDTLCRVNGPISSPCRGGEDLP